MTTSNSFARVKFGEVVSYAQPYVHPILKKEVPRDFYDRTFILKEARRILFPLENQQSLIFVGERRAGKTSILRLLLTEANESDIFVPVEIRWSSVNSLGALMQEMLQGLLYKLGADDRELWFFCKNVSREVDFYNAIEQIHAQYPAKIFVFGLDELDSIIKEQVRNLYQARNLVVFLGRLLDASLPVKLILTTTLDINNIYPDIAPKLESSKFRLSPFSYEDMAEMVTNIYPDINYSDLEKIYALSGGWPYFAKAILNFLVRLPPSQSRFEQAKSKAIERISNTWEYIYEKHWNDAERTLLLLLANRGTPLSWDEIEVIGHDAAIAARTLDERGYLMLTPDNKIRIRIGLLYEWFMQWPRFDEQKSKYLTPILKALGENKGFMDR